MNHELDYCVNTRETPPFTRCGAVAVCSCGTKVRAGGPTKEKAVLATEKLWRHHVRTSL